MNTEDLVSKEREEEIYHRCRKERRDAGGVGPLSRYDFGVGFRAALNVLQVEKIIWVPAGCAGCKYDAGWVDHPTPQCSLNGDEVCPCVGAVLVSKLEVTL